MKSSWFIHLQFENRAWKVESKIWVLDVIATSFHLEIFLKRLIRKFWDIPLGTSVVEVIFNKVLFWSPGEIDWWLIQPNMFKTNTKNTRTLHLLWWVWTWFYSLWKICFKISVWQKWCVVGGIAIFLVPIQQFDAIPLIWPDERQIRRNNSSRIKYFNSLNCIEIDPASILKISFKLRIKWILVRNPLKWI